MLGTECSLAGSQTTRRRQSTSAEVDHPEPDTTAVEDGRIGPISGVMEPVIVEVNTTKNFMESRLSALESRLRILEAQLATSTHIHSEGKDKRKFSPRLADGSADEHIEATQWLVRHEDLWGSFEALAGLSRGRGEGWRRVEGVVSQGAMRGAYLSYVRFEFFACGFCQRDLVKQRRVLMMRVNVGYPCGWESNTQRSRARWPL